MRYYSLAILLILALSACASKAAIEPEGGVDNIPENWDIETPIAINISEIWWDEFQDEKLNQFLSQFLAENINLEQAMLNTRIAVWSKGVNVFAPIFNAGKLVANKKIAKNNKEIAMLEFVNNLLNAYKEVESGLEFDRSTQLSLNLLKDNIILSESIYSTTFDEFEKGVSSIEDVINANNALFDNKNMLATTERIRIEQRINLILALGGGFTYKQ